MLYITAHFVLRPSLYRFHNILSVVSGVSELFEDIAVLEDIHGSGVLNGGVWWPLICIAVPVVVTVAQLIYSFRRWLESRCEEGPGMRQAVTPDMRKRAIAVENFSIPRFFLLAAFLTACGIIFTQLVVCAQFRTPHIILQFITSFLITCLLLIAIFVFSLGMAGTLDWSERAGEVESFDLVQDIKGWCLDLCGYCRRAKVAVENEENEEES
jgi:hypothetical protein